MADVFISYQHRDRQCCQRVAAGLEARSLSVWWDDQLHPRESWDRLIEREIQAAKAVVVLWTPNAVESDWVREEARYAKDHGKLVPAKMAPCSIPLGFGSVQTQSLENWCGESDDPQWLKFVSWIEALLGPSMPRHSMTAQREVTVVPVYEWGDLEKLARRGSLPADTTVPRARQSKYQRLHDHLLSVRSLLPLSMSFVEIEKVLLTNLPESARRDRSWWANTANASHVQARAWRDAGCFVQEVNFEEARVLFARNPTNEFWAGLA